VPSLLIPIFYKLVEFAVPPPRGWHGVFSWFQILQLFLPLFPVVVVVSVFVLLQRRV
jgi:hypothetical protein